MTEKKIRPNDGGNYYQKGDDDEKDEENESLEKEERYNKELEELEKRREEEKERKEEQKKRFEKNRENREKSGELKKKKVVKIGGQKVEEAKIFDHNKGKEGIFDRRGKVKNYQREIKNGLKGVRGLSSKERKMFLEIIPAYNPSKSVLNKKRLKKFLYGLKHKTYKGNDFNRMKKTVDTKVLKKEFSDKRKINKIEEKLFGKESRKHKMKSNSIETSRQRPSSSVSKIRNRF
jgi:hypothetical protein